MADLAIRGQPYGYRALVIILAFASMFGCAVVVAEPLLQHDQPAHGKAHRMSDQPPKCDCGTVIDPDPPGKDGTPTWRCSCRRFGYLLPEDYLAEHPEESAVQVCGRKRIADVPASVAA
ncbi:hypothetical protein AB0C76_38375 [Kitasatospora sp. NPDC048722]|uniref:hypothetical protein n=1 Tax=Kitasatospora sp. NPDC048722 TaxID=3155639 RepID=UPI003407B42A